VLCCAVLHVWVGVSAPGSKHTCRTPPCLTLPVVIVYRGVESLLAAYQGRNRGLFSLCRSLKDAGVEGH
jgi:hypothetical protein